MKNLYLLILSFLFLNNIVAQSSNAEAIIREGVKLHDAGKYKEALKKYEQVLKTDADNVYALQEASLTAITMGKYQESIAYSDRLIATGDESAWHGYMNKGSALDLLGKYEESNATYLEGIEKYPDEYLLHFNLGVNYFKREDIESAEQKFLDALYRNSEHSSSNLLLGYTQYYLDKRVRGMLALYYFLILEPSGERAEKAFTVLTQLMMSGVDVEKENNTTINININSLTDSTDAFRSVNTFLSLYAATTFSILDSGKSDFEKFYSYTNALAGYLYEHPKDEGTNSPFVQLYVSFFKSLKAQDLVKAYCYNISRTAFKESYNWLENNPDELKKLYEWFEAFTSQNSLRNETPLRIDPSKKKKRR